MDTNKLDDALLSEFMGKFYGYGNYGGHYWFIGKEEGGGNSLAEIQKRLNFWQQRGKRELEHLADYHRTLGGIEKFFAEPTTTQRTWSKLILILLALQSNSIKLDEVKNYQREKLGRPDSDNCLIELLPLPSPSAGKWGYNKISSLAVLKSRRTYSEFYAEKRALYIKAKIKIHEPKAVVFYSMNRWYIDYWKMIADADFKSAEIEGKTYHCASRGGTKFFIIKHPTDMGMKNTYYHEIGKLLSSV